MKGEEEILQYSLSMIKELYDRQHSTRDEDVYFFGACMAFHTMSKYIQYKRYVEFPAYEEAKQIVNESISRMKK